MWGAIFKVVGRTVIKGVLISVGMEVGEKALNSIKKSIPKPQGRDIHKDFTFDK